MSCGIDYHSASFTNYGDIINAKLEGPVACECVQSRLASLESRLAEAEAKLADERTQYEKLAKRFTAAIQSRHDNAANYRRCDVLRLEAVARARKAESERDAARAEAERRRSEMALMPCQSGVVDYAGRSLSCAECDALPDADMFIHCPPCRARAARKEKP